MTGLPQVTVPGGFMRRPLPVRRVVPRAAVVRSRSCCGLAYAYEQATHHRRPPATID